MNPSITYDLVDRRVCKESEQLLVFEGKLKSPAEIQMLCLKLEDLGFRIARLRGGTLLLAQNEHELFTFTAPDLFTLSRVASDRDAEAILGRLFNGPA